MIFGEMQTEYKLKNSEYLVKTTENGDFAYYFSVIFRLNLPKMRIYF